MCLSFQILNLFIILSVDKHTIQAICVFPLWCSQPHKTLPSRSSYYYCYMHVMTLLWIGTGLVVVNWAFESAVRAACRPREDERPEGPVRQGLPAAGREELPGVESPQEDARTEIQRHVHLPGARAACTDRAACFSLGVIRIWRHSIWLPPAPRVNFAVWHQDEESQYWSTVFDYIGI